LTGVGTTGFGALRSATGGSDNGRAAGTTVRGDATCGGGVTAAGASTGRCLSVTVTGSGTPSLRVSRFASPGFVTGGSGATGSIAGGDAACRGRVTAAVGGSTGARVAIAGVFNSATARGGSTEAGFDRPAATGFGISGFDSISFAGGASGATDSIADKGVSCRGGVSAPGDCGYRALASARPLSKSALLSHSLACTLSIRISSHRRATSISKNPCSFWSINCIPWPVTAHCLPIQWMSRCSGICYIRYLSRSMTLSPPI
jgi:hypothetical protein